MMNAVEASPEGACVRVRALATEAGIELQVEDAGPGLPADIRARLFQPHVSSKPAGAGMGLYLSERLARQRYGGGIALEDRAPRGTLARLRLAPRLEEAATDAG
jgi:signal transduction histidine kinase